MSQIDSEEKAILEDFEADQLLQSPDAADIQKRHQAYASAMFRKDARINLRLSSRESTKAEAKDVSGRAALSKPGY